MLLEEVVVAPVETLGERRLQGRITTGDVQGVAVVGNGQQVAHRRLTGVATIFKTHLTTIGELPTEVGRGAPVHHITLGDGVKSQIAIGELTGLRNDLNAHIEIVLLTNDAQHHFGRMDVVLILRETALVNIQELVVSVTSQGSKHGAPLTIAQRQARHVVTTCGVSHAPEIIGGTVALGVTILEVIAELQECCLEDRFAIGQAHVVVIILAWRHVVAVALIG